MYTVDGEQSAYGRLETLITRIQSGDQEAFRMLYDSLADRLFGYVASRTGSRADALDVVQDIFIDLWSALGRFSYRSDGHFYSFVFTIAKRKLYRHYKDGGRTESIDDLSADDHPRVEADITDRDGMRELVEKLPEKYRDVIVLRYWSDMPFAEIADALDTTESNVKVRHHRALEKLRDLQNNHE